MNMITGMVTGLSRILDKAAGLCMVAIMVLVVSNVILRAVFQRPILGTYDFVVSLTAAMIALALAYCAVQNGHIAVSFVFERLPLKIQAPVAMVVDVVCMVFWGLCVWQIGIFAQRTAESGVVSPTAQMPLYPFIYIVAFGLLVLCLVLLVRTIESFRKVFTTSPVSRVAPAIRSVKTIQKAASQ